MSETESALLTGGIGDFIALECYLTDAECDEVKTIYWATRAQSKVMILASTVFPNYDNNFLVHTTFANFKKGLFGFVSRNHIAAAVGVKVPPHVMDWSILHIFRHAQVGLRPFKGSRLMDSQIADLDYFDLPPQYYVIHPYSENLRDRQRDLTWLELLRIRKLAQRLRMPMVVIGTGRRWIPKSKWIIDLRNRTNILEAVEIIKGAEAFVGCASFSSVVASKCMPKEKIVIKGEPRLRGWIFPAYYAPITDPRIIVSKLTWETLCRRHLHGDFKPNEFKVQDSPVMW